MKTMKVALLATAALAAFSVSARADDAAAIKAQLEALTARIAQLEAAPAAPVGFSLLTISEGAATKVPGLDVTDKGYADTATIIGIMPTADAPASTTIEWSGYVRAAIVYSDYNDNWDDSLPTTDFDVDDSDSIDVAARGQLKVVGKTDTAVGEVGVQMQLRAEGWSLGTKSDVTMNEAWGWWAMTPELTLSGGYTASLGLVGYGYAEACSCYYTANADVATNPGDALQMRLGYASGPLSFAIALEDASGSHDDGDMASSLFAGDSDALGVAAEIKYSGDTVSGEISAAWHEAPEFGQVLYGDYSSSSTDGVDSYVLGAGLGFALGDMASLSFAGSLGRTNGDQDFWSVNALASANLSDSVHAELGAGWKTYDTSGGSSWSGGNYDRDVWGVEAGLYYEPVAQLTIGLEAEYTETEQDDDGSPKYKENSTTIDLVTVYRF